MPTTRQGTTVELGSVENRKKRRSSSASSSNACSPASRLRRNTSVNTSKETHTTGTSTPRTPQTSRKKVRFSDPGPQLQDGDRSATGLTPALSRTSLGGFGLGDPCTPSRRARQQPHQTLRPSRSYDSLSSFDTATSGQIVQFTPFREILDLRTQRRIRRTGLSDELNQYEREKRETTKHKKNLQKSDAVFVSAKAGFNALRKTRIDSEADAEVVSTATRPGVEDLELEINRLKEELSNSSHTRRDVDTNCDVNTVMSNVCDLEVDNSRNTSPSSPVIANLDGFSSPASDNPLPLTGGFLDADASTQANITDHRREAEFLTLCHDLEAAKEEKKALFNACRTLPTLNDTVDNSVFRLSSPPPDFLNQIVLTLSTALTRASDAARALEFVKDNISKLGFQGENVNDSISELQRHFRSARLDLERAIPGETPNVGLEDGSATLGALVKRVRLLIEELGTEHNRHNGTLGREKALKRQFDALVIRYDEAAKRIGNLEEETSNSSEKAHHTAMRIKEFECNGEEQAVEIEKLNEAMSRYCDEARRLETLVRHLETENTTCKEKYAQEISGLNAKASNEETIRHATESIVAEREASIHRLEDTIRDNRIVICDLVAKVEALENEKLKMAESQQENAAEQQQRHEHELGSMNVRISYLATSLQGAKSEVAKLHRHNNGLEEQLDLEIKAKNSLMHEWVTNQARSLASAREAVQAEYSNGRTRKATRESLLSDDLQSSSSTGSEPITPESMTRFVDVEVGRGKNRRRLDSGIGILTEGDLLDDCYVNRQIQDCLNSDIELPSSDPVHI